MGMMLHRHFENEKQENMTTLADLIPVEKEGEFVSEVFPPEEVQPKRRGRPKKNP